ncbi:MAG: phosphoribosylamine--glycine ligase [Candidatus Diapherotrites archaeon]
MKVLIIGSGGREHAICWKVKQSKKVDKIYCLPGNAGTAEIAENVPIKSEDINSIIEFAKNNKIDLAIIGPEVPLVLGIVEELEKQGIKAFGPNSKAAKLEGSKSFAKEIMEKAKVPTAKHKTISTIQEAEKIINEFEKGAAVKADGLAQGKGVIICKNQKEIIEAIKTLKQEQFYGKAGEKIVIEELLEGEEASVLAFCDGNTAKIMPPSQDHKRIYDNDKGPNTGGMGAYAPAPIAQGKEKEYLEKIFKPILNEMKKQGNKYKGVLYAGLMIKNQDFKVLEFNARFGDPETQAILPLLETDIIEIIEACITEKLDKTQIKWKNENACCVVLASKGYPGKYETGKKITGLKNASAFENIIVFHAGTKKENNEIITTGGRVLGITGVGKTLKQAIENAYTGASQINFEGIYYRTDIGKKGLK